MNLFVLIRFVYLGDEGEKLEMYQTWFIVNNGGIAGV
jgi:hypothetical protein